MFRRGRRGAHDGGQGNGTERSAAVDCDKAEAALDGLPEVARAAFAAAIVKRLPPEDADRVRLFGNFIEQKLTGNK